MRCLCASLLIMEREGCKIYLKKSGLRHPVTAAACRQESDSWCWLSGQ